MQTWSNVRVTHWLVAVALALGLGTAAHAEDKPATTTVVPGAQQWTPAGKDWPRGMRIMLIEGDPAQAGPYVVRVRVPSGYVWPPMKYPDERTTTILKGKLWYAEGDRRNPKAMQELEAGATFKTPAATPHYQWARTEVILQITGTGPVGSDAIVYVNPEDDPRQQ